MVKTCASVGCDKSGSKSCARCKAVAYCSPECQKSAWSKHKLVCKPVSTVSHPTDATMDVQFEDQQRINRFGRLNTRKSELESRLTALKDEQLNLDDAITEVELLDDDDEGLLLSVGEVFVMSSHDDVVSIAESKHHSCKSEITILDSERRDIDDEMNQLKALLYAKFGKSINLDV